MYVFMDERQSHEGFYLWILDFKFRFRFRFFDHGTNNVGTGFTQGLV
jgi:hypothetical protein